MAALEASLARAGAPAADEQPATPAKKRAARSRKSA